MDFKTASSILRSPWFIDEQMAASYYEEYLSVRATGGKFRAETESKIEPFNPQQKFFAGNVIKYAPIDSYSSYARSFEGFDGAKIAVIYLSGALMKNDYCGWLGTQSLLTLFNLACDTETIQQIVLLIDSPGGSVNGTFSFADAVSECCKPVTTVISGMCASAAYWIGSSAAKVYATSPTDIIGSIGTMITLVDQSKYLADMGIVVRTFYADDSVNKNAEFTQAQKGEGKMLVKNLLNPLNDQFKAAIEANRPDVKKEALTGKVYVGNDALAAGLIDGIMCMDDILEDIQAQVDMNTNNSLKIDCDMTPFTKTLKAASATEFKVVEGGFALNEANLTNIEAALTTAEATAADATAAKAEVVTANAALKAANDKIIALQDKVIAMGKLDGARFTATVPVVTTGANGDVVTPEKTDPVSGVVAIDPYKDFYTSADAELAVLKAKMNPLKKD